MLEESCLPPRSTNAGYFFRSAMIRLFMRSGTSMTPFQYTYVTAASSVLTPALRRGSWTALKQAALFRPLKCGY